MITRQLSVLALALAMLAGNGAVCAGWAPTPEARMACCSESDACPMHKGDVTQAQANSCCMSAEGGDSSQSNPTFATAMSGAILGPGIVLPLTVPALVLTDAWRTAVPVPRAAIPKYILLSVYLV